MENQLFVCLVYPRKNIVLQDFVTAYSQSHNSAEDKNYKCCTEDFLLNLGLKFLKTSKTFATRVTSPKAGWIQWVMAVKAPWCVLVGSGHLWLQMSTERSEHLLPPEGVSGLWWKHLLCVSEKHSSFSETDWETPGFGLDLGSRPSKCFRVWVLVPVLIKEMLVGRKKKWRKMWIPSDARNNLKWLLSKL